MSFHSGQQSEEALSGDITKRKYEFGISDKYFPMYMYWKTTHVKLQKMSFYR